MQELFWACFGFGVALAIVSVLFGDLISHALDGMLDFLSVDFLQPMVVAGAVTVFGGAGILLTEYASMGPLFAAAASLAIAVVVGWLIYVGYVRPMRRSERSSGFSMAQLNGMLGEVTVPIPAAGFGEVLVSTGAGHTNQVAASFDKEAIQAGARVVVVEIKDDTLYVSRFENKREGA